LKQQLQLIFDLSRLDLKLCEIKEKLERIPLRRAEIDALLGEKKTVLDQKLALIADKEKGRRDREGEVSLSESRLKDFQGKLAQIKTNKEYQAALKEMDETKKSNRQIEDQSLQLMTDLETLKKETEALQPEVQAIEDKFAQERSELQEEEQKMSASIQGIEEERNKLLSVIEASILDKYQRIKRVKSDAVSFVEGGACLGCNMNIPPQLVIEIRKLKTVYTCPTCHRILYLQEWSPEENKNKMNSKEIA
jgi:hypothetical protein